LLEREEGVKESSFIQKPSVKKKYPSPLKDIKVLLSLPQNASDDEVKNAYDKYIQEKEKRINLLQAQLSMIKIPSQPIPQEFINQQRYFKNRKVFQNRSQQYKMVKEELKYHLLEKEYINKAYQKYFDKK
jgi:hypothetical protein